MIAVDFYDKRSARRERAQLSVDAGGWRLSVGERQLQVPLDRARLSERLGSVPRRLELGKDGYCEIADHDGLNRLLERLPDAESGVVRAQNSLLVGIAAAALLLLIGVAGWIWGLPLAAEAGSRWVAESVRVELSEQILSVLEHRWLGESTLPAHDRERLQAALASMCGPAGESRKLRLSFRQGEAFGPNAFALPDGNVVMLDELYRLLDNDEQRLAVLAHEAGHVHHDHGIRALVRNSLIATAMTLWLGDISSWLAAAPVVFVHARHSREQEREADAYAAEWLSRNGIEPAALAAALERMTEALAASASGDDGGGAHFLSTHPAPAERIRTLRAAGQASAGCAA